MKFVFALVATLVLAAGPAAAEKIDGRLARPTRWWSDLVTMEPSGRYALVTNRYADQVAVIDVASHTQVRAIAVGRAPHGMALRPR